MNMKYLPIWCFVVSRTRVVCICFNFLNDKIETDGVLIVFQVSIFSSNLFFIHVALSAGCSRAQLIVNN